MTDQEDERRLIDGLRRNDRDCLATIYDNYAGLAYGMAMHTLGSVPEAEDVVQECFLALWRQAERLDPSRGIKSYLLTIVHNKSVDRLRQKARRPETTLDLDAPIPASGEAANPEETVTRLSEQRTVREALVGLPLEQRRTVEMTYYAGLTLSEVATRMQVPLGTVKSRLRLALGHLRRALVESS